MVRKNFIYCSTNSGGGSGGGGDGDDGASAYINYNIWAIPILPLLVFPPLISGPYDVNFVGTITIPK